MLRIADVRDLGEQPAEVVNLGHAVDLDIAAAATGARGDGKLRRAARGADPIDQVELQLDCAHRPKPLGGEAVDNPREHLAGIGDEGRAVLLELPQ